MDQVAGALSVVPAMRRCQNHRRHSLAHAHIPPTSNPQIHKYGYRSEGAPHLQPPPNLMCFHLTLLIHSTHAHTHIWVCILEFMNKHEWASNLYQHARKETHKHTHMVCSLHLPYSGRAPTCPWISVQRMFWHRTPHQYTWLFAIRWKHTHANTHSSSPSANQLIHRWGTHLI